MEIKVKLKKNMLVGNQMMDAGSDVMMDRDRAKHLASSGVVQIIPNSNVIPMPDLSEYDKAYYNSGDWPFTELDNWTDKVEEVTKLRDELKAEYERLHVEIATLTKGTEELAEEIKEIEVAQLNKPKRQTATRKRKIKNAK